VIAREVVACPRCGAAPLVRHRDGDVFWFACPRPGCGEIVVADRIVGGLYVPVVEEEE
jgi:uncharacterized C2H2 Zn-finger protein